MVLKKSLKNGFKLVDRGSSEDKKLESGVVGAAKHNVADKDNQRPALQPKEETLEESGEEEEAPDGGWGWIVTIGLIVVFVSTTTSTSFF